MLRVAFLNSKSKITCILKTIKNYVRSKKVRQYLTNFENLSAREIAKRLTVYVSASIYSTNLEDFCIALNNNSELRKILGISKHYSAKTIDYTIKKISPTILKKLLIDISRYIIKKQRISLRYVVIDGRKQQSYLNPKKKAIKEGKDPDAKWTRSASKGWVFGYNTVFVYDPFSGLFLTVKVYPGNVHDVKIYRDVLEDVKKNFKVENLRVLADKGFMANYNILAAVRDLKMVPYITPRKNTNLERLLRVDGDLRWAKLNQRQYNCIFNETKVRVKLMHKLYDDQKRMKQIRWQIEYVFSRFQTIFDLKVIKTLGLSRSKNYIQFRTWAFNLIILTSYIENINELRTCSKTVFS